MTGIELIAKERQEQIEKHGFDVCDEKNQKYYKNSELIDVAYYLLRYDYNENWWLPKSWGKWFLKSINNKRSRLNNNDFKIETYKIAGALIAAEIDRLQSLTSQNAME